MTSEKWSATVAALIVVGFTASFCVHPAQAQMFARPQPYRMPQRVPMPIPEYGMTLNCTPGFDPTDKNPPRNILVDVQVNDAGKPWKMEVAFDLRNGERIFRSRQYDARLTDDTSVAAGWTGTRFKDPRITMAGGVFADRNDNWFYREKQWKDGKVEWDYTAPCVPVAD